MKLMEYRKNIVEKGYVLLKKKPELIRRTKDGIYCDEDAPDCIKAVVEYENECLKIVKEMGIEVEL